MLHPALVLESSATVEAAIAELDRYPDFSQAVVRRASAEGEPSWFAIPVRRLRWLLQDAAPDQTLDAALYLDTTAPSLVRTTDAAFELASFEGVVLDGDQVVAVETAEQAALGSHRNAGGTGGERPRFRGAFERREAAAPPAVEATVVPVLFATDRAETGDPAPGKRFGSGRGPLSFGVAEVSIPRRHRRGGLEAPRWWRLELQPDPRRHVVLLSVSTCDREGLIAQARTAVYGSPRHDALVFVHGYNVSFENAARRTAQIAYDLRFQGPAMLYSWPSTGGTLRYLEDETNARWTVPHFGEFLSMAQSELGAAAVHVIAHSMGNRVLAECLRTHRPPLGAAKLQQVVLAAPDIDADTFADLAREFHAQAERVTLYASSRDLALKASKLVHGHPRAGDSEPPLVIADDVDTIDASEVDTNLLGHSYVGDTTSILEDVHDLLQHGQPPAERRFHLEPREQAGRRYWFFRM